MQVFIQDDFDLEKICGSGQCFRRNGTEQVDAADKIDQRRTYATRQHTKQ